LKCTEALTGRGSEASDDTKSSDDSEINSSFDD
jgi:hypothetical protein